MDNIIGRKEDKNELSEAFSSNKAEFIVIYGRRRVGKTFLVEQYFKSKKCTYFHVTGVQDGTIKEQLSEFAKAIGRVFYGGATIATPATWAAAFEELTNAIAKLPKTQKIILFIDELPWMATKRSRITQGLDYYWNHYWSKDKRIKLTVCGSSASWIIKNIIHNKGGLHNRYTRSLLIKPFTLQESSDFLKSRGFKLSNKQLLHIYMAIGGIPHYLDKLKKGLSATQNIQQLCFREAGILFSEFDKLFKSLFENAKTYVELIRIIAKSREGVPRNIIEDSSKLSTKGGTLSDRLNDLEQAGFIKSFLPLEHQRQGVYYRIIDEYSYFYLKWIEPEKQTLLSLDPDNDYWIQKSKTPLYQTWAGYAFESVCYKHIAQIRKKLKIPSGARVGTWRYSPKRGSKESGTQIDLLFDRDDDTVTICEIKCTDQPFVIDKKYYSSLANKKDVYVKITKTAKQIFIAFISANGLKQNTYSNHITGDVMLDDLV
jgi:AAA+ ATPase superfamily predicted ATPase